MFRRILTVTSLVLAFVGFAQAGFISLLTTPDSATYSPDFSLLGGNHTDVASGTMIDSITTVSDSNANSPAFDIDVQGTSWPGNFSPGQIVLFNNDQGPDTFTFSSPQHDFGVLIQDENFGPFTATITAYDASHMLLGSFNEAGTSNGANDGSAIFVGVATDSDIASVVISTGSNGFAVANGMTPEPASFLLMGSALLVAGRLARRRK